MTCNDCPNQADEAAFVREMQHAEMMSNARPLTILEHIELKRANKKKEKDNEINR